MWDEWIKALRTALLGDTALTTMLGSPDGIYRKMEPDNAAYPCIVMTFPGKNPTGLVGGGRYRPRIVFSCLATNVYVGENIAQYLEDHWQIPSKKPDGLETDHWRIDGLTHQDTNEGGIIRQLVNGDQVHEIVADFEAIVVRKPD